MVSREGPCWREEHVYGQTPVAAAQLPYGHRTVPVPGAVSCGGNQRVKCLSCQAVQICTGWHSAGGSTVLRGPLGTGHGGSGGLEQSARAQQTLLSILSIAAKEIKERWIFILRKVS